MTYTIRIFDEQGHEQPAIVCETSQRTIAGLEATVASATTGGVMIVCPADPGVTWTHPQVADLHDMLAPTGGIYVVFNQAVRLAAITMPADN